MLGVLWELIEHTFKVDPKATPKKQLLQQFAQNKREAIKKELRKTTHGKVYQRSLPSRVASQPYTREKEKQQRVENVC